MNYILVLDKLSFFSDWMSNKKISWNYEKNIMRVHKNFGPIASCLHTSTVCVWVKPQSWHFLLHITWEKILISICAEPELTCRKLQGLCSFHINENEINFRLFKITKLTKKNVFVCWRTAFQTPCQSKTKIWTRYLALIRS